MISKRDSKPFQVKFPIGVEKTTKVDMQYDDNWHVCFGIMRDNISGKNPNVYGYDVLYDKTITVNAGSITRLINENTLVIIDDVPTSVYETGNFSISKVYPEYNGEIVIGLNKKEDINIPKLYFESNGKILYYQLNFDSETKKAYIPIRAICPFKKGDYVWTREPADASVTRNRLKLKEVSKYGVDGHFKSFYELSFVEE